MFRVRSCGVFIINRTYTQLRSHEALTYDIYRILKGGWFKGDWGTFGKLREYEGILGITRLPTPIGPPPVKDILRRDTVNPKLVIPASPVITM